MRCLILGSSFAILAASPAFGQKDSSQAMPVVAHAPQICAVEQPQLTGGAHVNFRGLNGSTLQIDQLVDPATLAIRAASVNVKFAAVCNYPHRVSIETQNNGLWQTSERSAVPAPGFAYAIPYRATIDWGSAHGELQADAKTRKINDRSLLVGEPSAGDIVLRLEIEAGASNIQANAPLLAGFYGDTLRVIVEPQ
jgi:hypothetical protein